MKDKRSIFSWCLFDWANSPFPTIITTFIFATYYTQKVAINKILGTQQWGYMIGFAGIVIAILSPIVGSIADKSGPRKPWLVFFSAIVMISTSALWYAAPNQQQAIWLLGCVFVGTIGFEVGTVFYNAMLKDIAPRTHIGRVSGWGWGAGYIGGLVCLIIALVFFIHNLAGLPTQEAENIRICGPLVGIWLLIFSIPLFLFTQDTPKKSMGMSTAINAGLKTLCQTLRHLRKYKEITKFLLAKMLYLEGLNTLFVFGGIYFAGTFGASLSEVVVFGISLNITAALGAISFAWLDDWIGPKKTIFISLFGLMLTGGILLIIHSKTLFWLIAIILGCFVGPVQAASRSLMTRLTPPEMTTELFGLYATTGKVTSFLGPWLVGYFTAYFASQRIGMTVIILFFIVGTILLYWVVNPTDVSISTKHRS